MARSAGFLGKRHADKTRDKIKSSQLFNRYLKYACGDLKDTKGEPIEIPQGQLTAMKHLVDKILPSLAAVESFNENHDVVEFKKPDWLK